MDTFNACVFGKPYFADDSARLHNIVQGVKLLVKVLSKTATTATIQLCKYNTAPSQCVFPPPPVRRGDFRITLYENSRFSASSTAGRLQFRFSWTPGTSRCYEVANLNQWVRAKHFWVFGQILSGFGT